jgi:hypothetical protein
VVDLHHGLDHAYMTGDQLRGIDDTFMPRPQMAAGQYFVPYAYRTGLTGFVPAPITAMWNVRRG